MSDGIKEPLKDCAAFEASFPDEAVWSDEGDLVVPGGNAISTAVFDILKAASISTTEPKQHSYYGWLIVAKSEGVRVECLLQDLEPWILLTEAKGGIFKKRERFEFHRKVLQALRSGLERDSRFSSVDWATRTELVAQGKFKR